MQHRWNLECRSALPRAPNHADHHAAGYFVQLQVAVAIRVKRFQDATALSYLAAVNAAIMVDVDGRHQCVGLVVGFDSDLTSPGGLSLLENRHHLIGEELVVFVQIDRLPGHVKLRGHGIKFVLGQVTVLVGVALAQDGIRLG